jgi:hypothetical protein
MATFYDRTLITIPEGDDVALDLSLTSGGSALDLTGAAAIAFGLYAQTYGQFSGAALISKTLGSGVAVVSAEGGTVAVTIAAADTADMGGATYYAEIEITDGSGNQTTPEPFFVTIRNTAIA